MKTLRFMAIIFAGCITVNMQAAEYYALQRMYQTAKDPVQRAAILKRMQDTKIAAQQGIRGGLTSARERLQNPEWRAAKIQNFKRWASQNKDSIIAATAILTAAAIAGGLAAAWPSIDKAMTLRVFEKNGVDLSNPAVKQYALAIGRIAQQGWDSLEEVLAEEGNDQQFALHTAFMLNNPPFLKSVAELARVSEDFLYNEVNKLYKEKQFNLMSEGNVQLAEYFEELSEMERSGKSIPTTGKYAEAYKLLKQKRTSPVTTPWDK